MSSPPLKIAIIGAGPGGLATAIALRDVPNVHVEIYEQASVLREIGAGISIGANAWRVLELLGVAGEIGEQWEVGGIVNRDGHTGEELNRTQRKKVEGDAEGRKAEGRKARPTIRTQRTTLQSALLAALPPTTPLHLGKKLVSLAESPLSSSSSSSSSSSPSPTSSSSSSSPSSSSTTSPPPLTLTFSDSTTTTATLVLGADGIRSAVRAFAFPSYPLAYTGTTIWRAMVPFASVQDLDAKIVHETGWWHAADGHVWFSRVGEGEWEIAARRWVDPGSGEGGRRWGGEGEKGWKMREGVSGGEVEAEFGVSCVYFFLSIHLSPHPSLPPSIPPSFHPCTYTHTNIHIH